MGSDLVVLGGIVEKVHYLSQGLLGLLLARHIGKFDAGLGGDVHLGPGFAEGHGVAQSVGAAGHLLDQQFSQSDKDHHGQHPLQQYGNQGGLLGLDYLGAEGGAGIGQLLHQVGIIHLAGLVIIRRVGGVGKHYLVFLYLNLFDLLVLQHLQEGAVVHFLHLLGKEAGEQCGVQQQKQDNCDDIVPCQRLFG